jgi:hypothetical protein
MRICNACGKCCNKCLNSCGTKYLQILVFQFLIKIHIDCDCCGKLFEKPFACCAFLSLFLLGAPFIIAFYYAFANLNASECDKRHDVTLIIIGKNSFNIFTSQ